MAVWTGRAESDGFSALVLARRADLAPGDDPARVRQVLPAGRFDVRPGLPGAGPAWRTSTSPSCWSRSSSARFDPQQQPTRHARAEACEEIEDRVEEALDDVASLDQDRILRGYLAVIKATLRTNYYQTAADGGRKTYLSLKLEPRRDPGPAGAAAEVRDLRLLTAGRGRAPAVRAGRPRRPALVGPPRRLPHRGPRPGQGADGEERRDRAGRLQGRLLLQAAARPVARPRGLAGRGHRPATRRSSADCWISPTTWWRARRFRRADVVRHDGDDTYLVVAADKGTATFSDIANKVARRTTASGSATRSPPADRRATTTRRWASPPAAPGSRSSGTSASAGSTARPRTSPASASAT